MLETAIDLGMQGIPLKTTLTAFFEVREFRALGSESFPMCRAIRHLRPDPRSFFDFSDDFDL